MADSPGLVASAVRAELARRGLTQRQTAAVLQKSQQAVSHKVRGLSPFTTAELFALAAWLDVPVHVLMGEPQRAQVDLLPHQIQLAQAVPA